MTSVRVVSALLLLCLGTASGCVVFTDTSPIAPGDVADGADVADDTASDAPDISDTSDVPDAPDVADFDTPDVEPDAIVEPHDPCADGVSWCAPNTAVRVSCEGAPAAFSCAFGCLDGVCRDTCAVATGCSADASATVTCQGGAPVEDDACPVDFACSDAGCRNAEECVPGTSSCTEDGDVLVCDQTGTTLVRVPCADDACVPVWPDLDDDGWGDGSVPRAHACGVPEGMSANRDDCDDFTQSGSDTPCPGWVIVHPGEFVMGTPVGEVDPVPALEAQQRVRITRRILVMETEVTQAMWAEDSQAPRNPSFNSDCADCPVERVNWFDVLRYANERSIAEGLPRCYTLGECSRDYGTGCEGDAPTCDGYACDQATFVGLDCQGYRLPSEAEWEYFTRAGTVGAYSGVLEDVGWYRESEGEMMTRPVRQLAPNDWGLYDVHGNAAEWVMDIAAAYRGDLEEVRDDALAFGTPSDVSALVERVTRGGAYNATNLACRAGARGVLQPNSRTLVTGFRLVRTFEEPP